MKVLLYFENQNLIAKSGIGRALKLQQQALSYTDVEVSTDVKSIDYDVLHINTYGINSHHMVNKAHKMGKKLCTTVIQLMKIFVTLSQDRMLLRHCLKNI
ncbi:hypothetical protein GCM10025879_07930 [Leuconostoc litchii]|nr:hypothetical protein GCM10025879_07930 [Leuconostoc litchii]